MDQCVLTPSFSDSCFEKNSVVVVSQREGEMFKSSCWKIFPFFFSFFHHNQVLLTCKSDVHCGQPLLPGEFVRIFPAREL